MSSNNWWAKKLSTNPSPQSTPATNLPTGNVYRPSQQTPNVQVSYDPQQDQLVTRAQSAKDTERCPSCMSGNYMAPVGTQRKRCYDCGYPIVQSGTGVGGTGQGAAPIAAKQPNQGNGFNPTVIVDRM